MVIAAALPVVAGAGGGAAAAGGASWLMPALMGTSIATDLFGALGASKSESDAAEKAAETQMAMYQQTRTDLAPWRATGQEGMYNLADIMGISTPGRDPSARFGEYARPITREQVQLDPGYEFRRGEGEQAIERAQAARGNFFAGQAGKELARYGQDYASGEYGKAYERTRGERENYFSRLFGISEAGRGAAGQTGQIGASAARGAGSAYMAGGEARGAGYTGAASAINQGIGNYLTYDMMKNPTRYPGMSSYN